MQWKRLKITNLRNHSNTDLDLTKKVNVFIGPNASGKSSIVDAMAFLLTGTNMRTTKSGEGMDEVVTFGESRALVGGDIGGIGKITRTIPHTFQVADWEGTITGQMETLYEKLGLTKDGVLCSIYSDKFLEMTSNEQKDFMFKLMGIKITDEHIQKEFENWCSENSITNFQALWDFVAANFKKGSTIFGADPSSFTEVYNACVDMRKIIKKELKQLEVLAKSIESKLPQGITIDNRDSVIAKLTDLRQKRDELMIKLGNVKAKYNKKAELEDKLSRAKFIRVPEESQADLKKALDDIFAQIKAKESSMAKGEAESSRLADIIKKLLKFDGKCPLSELIECHTGREVVARMAEEYGEKKAKVVAVLEKLVDEYDKLKETGSIISNKLELRMKADMVLPEIEKNKAELEEMNKTGIEDPTTVNEEIRRLDERSTKGQVILTAIEAEISNDKRRIDAKNNFDRKTNELKTLDILAEAFGSKGIKSILLNKAMRPVEKRANERLAVLTSNRYQINFRIDEDDFNIYVISEGIERRLKHLSSSEVLRIGVIMQDAINSITGAKFLVVDNVDILDKDNRDMFWSLIEKIKPAYDSIIILATGTAINSTPTEDTNYFLLGKKAVTNEMF